MDDTTLLVFCGLAGIGLAWLLYDLAVIVYCGLALIWEEAKRWHG